MRSGFPLGGLFGHPCDEYLSVRLTFAFVHMHLEGVCLIICVRVTCTLDSFVFRRYSGMIEITIGWAASLFVGTWSHIVLEYERTRFMISYC
jgi:hypothetical protein